MKNPPNLKEMSDTQLQAKPCKNCGVVFKNSKHPRQPYCSRPCYDAIRSAQTPCTCKVCGVDFTYYKSRGNDVKYCSQKCYLTESPLLLNRYVTPRGEGHWNWKGGIIKGRPDRNLVEYKDWRYAVFKRDDFTCQHCNKRGGYLEADHIESWTDFPELRYEVDNGRTLCKECHRQRTSRQLKARFSHAV